MHSARRNKRAVIPREVHLQTLPADVAVSISERIAKSFASTSVLRRRRQKGGGLEPAAFRFFSSGSSWVKG
jgi:hypothetical protein